jgi:hypothetical protein
MSITRSNLQRTRNELDNVERLMNEARALAIAPRQGTAQAMSPAELEFGLRAVANSLISLLQTFDQFLVRAEQDSARQPAPAALPRMPAMPAIPAMPDRTRPGAIM